MHDGLVHLGRTQHSCSPEQSKSLLGRAHPRNRCQQPFLNSPSKTMIDNIFQATEPKFSWIVSAKTSPPVLREQVQAPAPALALSLPFPRCCQKHDRCYDQAKKLDSCKFLLDNPYTKTYSYSCSGSEITCSSMFTPLLACWARSRQEGTQ